MTVSGTRGIIRVAENPRCEVQAAMAAEKVREPDFYRAVTGEDYPKEYGERASARRRGTKFEVSLFENDAGRLRAALGPVLGVDPADLTVRNFDDELPGAGEGRRVYRTRRVFDDLARGDPVPDILVQAHLELWAPGGTVRWVVKPDLLVLDREGRHYIPGDAKSFIVRDGVGAPGDLRGTRLQVAVALLALELEMNRVGLDVPTPAGLLQFALPFGLAPAKPVIERLDADVASVRVALQAIAVAQTNVAQLRIFEDEPLPMLIDELDIFYRDSCHTSCVMARFCKERVGDSVALIGNQPADALGANVTFEQVVQLLLADPDALDEFSRSLAIRLQQGAELLGLDFREVA